MKKLLTAILLLCAAFCQGQIIAETGYNYDTSVVIKTAEYWDGIMKKCMTSTFIMQRGGMQEVYSDGGMSGGPLIDTLVSFTFGGYEYKVWSTGDCVIYMLMKSNFTNRYWFRRLFSNTEEIFEVVSVENKIDKVYKIGLSFKN